MRRGIYSDDFFYFGEGGAGLAAGFEFVDDAFVAPVG